MLPDCEAGYACKNVCLWGPTVGPQTEFLQTRLYVNCFSQPLLRVLECNVPGDTQVIVCLITLSYFHGSLPRVASQNSILTIDVFFGCLFTMLHSCCKHKLPVNSEIAIARP